MHNLNRNLKYLRKKHGKNQSDIANLVGKASNTVGNWESAISEPSISELLILSKFFEVTLDDLIIKDLSKDPEDKVDDSELWKEVKALRKEIELLKKK